ncbi:MAG: GIY-YIG nuclease family protein [Methanomassiliicoccaceae archaeon]|nr:GIY-YIG nuclease family protein [Methanomassiliicoccaceae archaeon]
MIRKGTYVLIFDLPDIRVKVGALGMVDLKRGTYCYVGSAMNGLDQRISRHLSENKKTHWHIDHLTKECCRIEAYEAVQPGMTECALVGIVEKNGGAGAVKGFGCSDCKCVTHLFFLEGGSEERLRSDPRLIRHVRQHVRG